MSSLVAKKIGGFDKLWGTFTFSNNRDPSTLVKLNRFLINPAFLLAFPNLNQILLCKSISDHNVIILENVFSD
ncbi:hypothetical protein GQ457_08G026990 [Hibiscus cannabinus]